MMIDTLNGADFPIPSSDARFEAIQELRLFFNTPAKNFDDAINAVAIDGGCTLFQNSITALPVIRTHRTAGYNYSLGAKMIAYVRVGITASRYWVIQSLILDGTSTWVSHYYKRNGDFAFSEGPSTHLFQEVEEKTFEPRCPILNLLYTLASIEYPKTSEGDADTSLLHTIERILRKIQATRGEQLSFNQGARDPSIALLNQNLIEVERDPIYRWKERQALIRKAKAERALLIRTKKRVHKKGFLFYSIPLLGADFKQAVTRYKINPASNTLGILETLLIDPIRWFFKVVRGNMGYSVALAIYSPFTFFFITQPMNPHAMWAVGKVRSAYIESIDTLKTLTGTVAATSLVAVETKPLTSTPPNAPPNRVPLNQETHTGMPLTGENSEASTQSWEDRMSNFKAMQIAYEGNLEIAPRIGRLEQMETQLNWPLIVESTWLETERYLSFAKFLLTNEKEYSKDFIGFVKNEKSRAEQVQLYLWDRNIRFILDHPFTLMDESKEQTELDHYVGRSFILLKEMTQALTSRYQGLSLPAGYERIMNLAHAYEREYHAGGSILERLKKNSKLFAQSDPKSTTELRTYMKRQWEVLYLLQNHAQEAANSGLQMYNWSIRNTVHLLQSIYSTKREELSLIALHFKKGLPVSKISQNLEFKTIDSQYEALFHMMVLEFTSIRKELSENLKNDIEANQRKTMIQGLESFFEERDSLLKGANLI